MAKQNKYQKTRSLQLDLLTMLAMPMLSSWYFYGLGAIRLICVSVITCVLCELIGRRVLRHPSTVSDLSAVVTGILIALMLPANAPVWLPAVGGMFATVVAKLPFGSTEKLPFSPAAAGFSFLTICFPNLIFDYPRISAISIALSNTGSSSLASMLSQNTSVSLRSVKALDILVGNFPGTMGASCIIVLVGSAIYLLIRRTKLFITTAGFLTGAALMAICFPRVTNLFSSLVLELCAGYMIFAAVFLITEHSTQPKHPLSRLLYGFTAGVSCMLMRRFGTFEECACFAVLIINAAWPVIDKAFMNIFNKRKKKST